MALPLYQTGVNNLVDGSNLPAGVTLNPAGQTASYKVYTGTLSSGTPTVLDVFTDLGRSGSKLSIINTIGTSVTFTVEFSYDGTNYGDAITMYSSFPRNLDMFIPFKKIRLTRVSSNSTYDILVI